jgi:spore coat protein U-like protein
VFAALGVKLTERKKSKMKLKPILALAAGLLVFGAAPTLAQGTAVGTMAVGATVARTCTLSATNLAFGTLSVTANTTATSVVTVVCNGVSTVPSFTVGLGENEKAATPLRQMKSTAGDLVPYLLSVTAGGAELAVDGAVVLVAVVATDNFEATIYGAVPFSSAYPLGEYTDTVVLTAAYTP